MTIATLQSQIDARADSELRRRIDDKLEAVRMEASRLGIIQFQAAEVGQTAQLTSVQLDAMELVTILADAAHARRRDGNRTRAVQDFLERVATANITVPDPLPPGIPETPAV